jgi:hypothetical protein
MLEHRDLAVALVDKALDRLGADRVCERQIAVSAMKLQSAVEVALVGGGGAVPTAIHLIQDLVEKHVTKVP